MRNNTDKKEKRYSIYCHICPNGKRYIGMTSSELKVRFGNGNHYSKTTRFGRAIQEFGWKNITNEILECGLDFDEACKKREILHKFIQNNTRRIWIQYGRRRKCKSSFRKNNFRRNKTENF